MMLLPDNMIREPEFPPRRPEGLGEPAPTQGDVLPPDPTKRQRRKPDKEAHARKVRARKEQKAARKRGRG